MTKYHGVGSLLLIVREAEKSKIKVPAWSCSGEGSLWFVAGAFLPCPHMVEGAKDLSGASFIKAPITFMGAPPALSKHLPKTSSPNTTILGV